MRRDIVVVGASAGGVEALRTVLGSIRSDFDAAMFIVLHIGRGGVSALPQILRRVTKLPAMHAVNGKRIESRHIYIAPPDHHLILQDGRMHLSRGPEENGARPAVDPLFRSAARTFGPRTIGVVLSGALDDGSAGLVAVKARGGLAVVQDPDDALHAGMPRNAMESVHVDHVTPASKMGPLLARLVSQKIKLQAAGKKKTKLKKTKARELDVEIGVAEFDERDAERSADGAQPADVTCPLCHGTLFDHSEGALQRFRCRVGHAYSLRSLEAHQRDNLDDALWIAYRTLKENAALAKRLSANANERGSEAAKELWNQRAVSAEERAELIHRVLRQEEPPADEDKRG